VFEDIFTNLFIMSISIGTETEINEWRDARERDLAAKDSGAGVDS
jgi:hypothetical protein